MIEEFVEEFAAWTDEFAWFLCWLAIFRAADYQFKVCCTNPVTLFFLKFIESVLILFLLKLFVLVQFHKNNMGVKDMVWKLYNYTKVHANKWEL